MTLGPRIRTPQQWNAIPCGVCNQPILTTMQYATHDACHAKPRPCECGNPGMPYPLCAHCHGTGWLEDRRNCPHCPPAPCFACTAKTLIRRAAEHRDRQTTNP